MEKHVLPSQTKVHHRFIKGLRQIYAEEFAPLASSLGGRGFVRLSTGFHGVLSTWVDFTADQSPKAIFSIPPGIDTANPNAEIMAGSIIESWTPGPVTDALRPILVSLLKLGQRFPAAEMLEEDVSESVYVMF